MKKFMAKPSTDLGVFYAIKMRIKNASGCDVLKDGRLKYVQYNGKKVNSFD